MGEQQQYGTLLARQPILDRRQAVFAYELLFRSSESNHCPTEIDPIQATRSVVATSLCVMGLEDLARGRHVFINFPDGLLTEDFCAVLPKEKVVIEVLESTMATSEVLENCRTLKRLGYTLALDDVVSFESLAPFLEIVDIVKVDFLGASPEFISSIADRLRGKKRLLAEKVETQEDHNKAMSLGFDLFQGYFFARPVLVKARNLPTFKPRYLRLLAELHRPEMHFDRIESMIAVEAPLVYQLLKFVNSSVFGLLSPMASVRQAMIFLGEEQIRKWTAMVAITGMARDKPEEILINALVRARLIEQLAQMTGNASRAPEFFLVGMLSRLDAIMGCPLKELLVQIPLREDVLGALLRQDETSILAKALALADAFETGTADAQELLASNFGLPVETVAKAYLEAIRFADSLYTEGFRRPD